MELQKFEKDFRKKLLQREVAPSPQGWDKLEARLEKAEERKRGKYRWAGIAACIAGAAFMLTQYYFDPAISDSPGLVESPAAEQGEHSVPIVPETTVVVIKPEDAIPAEVTAQGSKIAEPAKEEAVPASSILAESSVSTRFEGKQTTGPDKILEEEDASEIEEVVAQIQPEKRFAGVTDEEVDALLHKAASELSINNSPVSETVTIDAESLLFEVEMELERSFRDKIFDLLKEGYLRTKTTVANRNF